MFPSHDQLEIVALTEQELCELHDQELYDDASWYGDVNTISFDGDGNIYKNVKKEGRRVSYKISSLDELHKKRY